MSDYRRNYAHTKLCIECGSEYRGKNAQKYCSKRCGILVNNRKRTKKPPKPPKPSRAIWIAGRCVECSSTFVVMASSGKYCSKNCAGRAAWRRKGSRLGHFYPTTALRALVYGRDELICQICLEPTDPSASPSSDWYPSLDHVVPRSKGGSDRQDNLRTAHRWCNAVRGDESYYTDADLRVA